MKKMAVALGASLFVSVVTALPAFADSSVPKPKVLGAGGTNGTAFTGANLVPALIAFVVLAAVGFSVLALQHRRAVAS